tara:strand:- start:840 stop:1082 length:243 start_codon:yes stop_codon:yes gene_type:complete
MVSPVGYTHRGIPALTLMMLMERRSDATSPKISTKKAILILLLKLKYQIRGVKNVHKTAPFHCHERFIQRVYSLPSESSG